MINELISNIGAELLVELILRLQLDRTFAPDVVLPLINTSEKLFRAALLARDLAHRAAVLLRRGGGGWRARVAAATRPKDPTLHTDSPAGDAFWGAVECGGLVLWVRLVVFVLVVLLVFLVPLVLLVRWVLLMLLVLLAFLVLLVLLVLFVLFVLSVLLVLVLLCVLCMLYVLCMLRVPCMLCVL